eukprot:9943482-Alexandrium_andersonii.AAC.1
MGHLLTSLGDIGLRAFDGLMIGDGVAPPLHVLDAPYSAVLALVQRGARARAMEEVASRRSTFMGGSPPDPDNLK